MENDNLTWLCAELGLPAVTEAVAGVVTNQPAQASGCAERASSLETALCTLLQCPELAVEVAADIAQARAGAASARVVNGPPATRLLLLPLEAGRVRAIVAPEQLNASAEISRRASLVDVAAAVSHEVSNAVGAIAGWAELAGQPGSGISSQEALKLIASCARTAQDAAKALLGLARGDANTEADEIDFSELAGELLNLLSVTARELRVRLSHDVEPGLLVLGSRAQLFTTLWNLTKNALEACSPSGHVAVQLSENGGRVQLEVRDTGPGLDQDQIARIFTRYYSTKTTGTGLGLALVQQAIAELGGELTVRSAKGHGTTFCVLLPRASRPSKVVPAPSLAPVANHTQPHGLDARILVVDDDDALREMVATALTLRGADVVQAKGSEQAKLAEGRFDIALIDMMLDEYRGDELLAALRRRGTVSAAMLVTGTVQKPRLVPGGEPDDWLRKPFDLGHLVERIRRTLDRHQMLNSVSANIR